MLSFKYIPDAIFMLLTRANTRSLPVPSVQINDLYLVYSSFALLRSLCDKEGSADGNGSFKSSFVR